MIPEQTEFEVTFKGQIKIKDPKKGTFFEAEAFKIKAQNIYPPAELMLSVKPTPEALQHWVLPPGYLDGEWLHFVMKPAALDAHPDIFTSPNREAMIHDKLDTLVDLNNYELIAVHQLLR